MVQKRLHQADDVLKVVRIEGDNSGGEGVGYWHDRVCLLLERLGRHGCVDDPWRGA
jgi:hypothetical protein